MKRCFSLLVAMAGPLRLRPGAAPGPGGEPKPQPAGAVLRQPARP